MMLMWQIGSGSSHLNTAKQINTGTLIINFLPAKNVSLLIYEIKAKLI